MSQLIPFAFTNQDSEGLIYSTDPSLSANRKRECPTSESLTYDETRKYADFTDGQEPDSDLWRIASSPLHLTDMAGSDFSDTPKPNAFKRQKSKHSESEDTYDHRDLERIRQDAFQAAVNRIHKAISNGIPSIDLSDLQLRRIPDDIGDVKDLVSVSQGFEQSWEPNIHVFLNNNILSSLPPRLFDISNLTVLSLRNNQLTELPPAIGKLINLQDLSVAANQLKYLPSQILELPKLQILSLHPNPFLAPPDDDNRLGSPPASQSIPAVTKRYAFSLFLNKPISHLSYSHAPSLTEICLNTIALVDITNGDRKRWCLDNCLEEMIDVAVLQRKKHTICGICKRHLTFGVGHAIEWWDGVVGNKDVAIQKNFCCYGCVEQWEKENDYGSDS